MLHCADQAGEIILRYGFPILEAGKKSSSSHFTPGIYSENIFLNCFALLSFSTAPKQHFVNASYVVVGCDEQMMGGVSREPAECAVSAAAAE